MISARFAFGQAREAPGVDGLFGTGGRGVWWCCSLHSAGRAFPQKHFSW